MSANNPAGVKKYLPFIIIGAVLALVIVVAAVVFRQPPANTTAQTSNTKGSIKREPLPGAQPPHVRGQEGAPVTLEEFADFQCGQCANFHHVLKRIESSYGSRVRVIFRNLPLQTIHKNAFSAARAAEAAAVQGRFWQMHDMLYEKQEEWNKSAEPRVQFTEYAKGLGLDLDRFRSDMDSERVVARIRDDFDRAQSLRLTGTPTVFLNGTELPPERSLTEEKLRIEIDNALAGKTGGGEQQKSP